MIQPFLQAKLSEVTRILKENRVTNAYAFGSVCTEQFNTDNFSSEQQNVV